MDTQEAPQPTMFQKRQARIQAEAFHNMVFKQIPQTIRQNVEMHLQTDLFGFKYTITLRVIGRKTECSFEVLDTHARDDSGVLQIKVPDDVLAKLCVVA